MWLLKLTKKEIKGLQCDMRNRLALLQKFLEKEMILVTPLFHCGRKQGQFQLWFACTLAMESWVMPHQNGTILEN